ncbi:MAG: hypothetical protein AB4352_21125 [Hormoscilla sp.]
MSVPTEKSRRSDGKAAAEIDTDVMFDLIDRILPFEACLYHQVLPMKLIGSKLHLGMVDRSDNGAIDYFRRLMAYLNCSVVPEEISSQTHQKMLSAYLKQASKKQSGQSLLASGSQKAAPRQEKKPASDSVQPDGQKSDASWHTEATLIVDSPEELKYGQERDTSQGGRKTLPRADRDPIKQHGGPPRAIKGQALPKLEVQARHLSTPVEELIFLPPQELLQELLARVLMGGIGRLYFERHKDCGRILWSLNGVLQSVLESIPPAVFQGVINELKRLTRMPLLPVQKAKQVEIERLYQQTRLLLRLRVMPGTHGEDATLQVLRGAALKFYQQQQLTSLGRDALTIAQQLQQKLNEIEKRTQDNPSLGMNLEALPVLNQILNHLNQQLQDLTVKAKQR